MPTNIADTTPEARLLQDLAQRRLTGGQRLLMALEKSLLARELAKARILKMHPHWTEIQIAGELLRMAFCPENLLRRAMRPADIFLRVTQALAAVAADPSPDWR